MAAIIDILPPTSSLHHNLAAAADCSTLNITVTSASTPPVAMVTSQRDSFSPSTLIGQPLGDYYYAWVHTHVISRQSCALGLFPSDDQGVAAAHVTDNVYTAVTLWGLSKVFDRISVGSGRSIELQQTAIKTMRAILRCFTMQLGWLEKFKLDKNPDHCLQVLLNQETGQELPRENIRLQLQPVSLYLFYLSQMVRSGLTLVYTLQECHIIQNLVYYVQRAYRIRDHGHWAEGGEPELSASSVGMTVAALQACDGLNLFGERGSHESALFVDPDALYRNMDILQNLLPRESKSREVDAALITIKGFPAFVVEDTELCEEMDSNIDRELLGCHGYRRFVGDCNEAEFPHLLLFQMITNIFEGKVEHLPKYRDIIKSVIYDHGGFPAIPSKFHNVSGSYYNECDKQHPSVVSQSLLILTDLLERQLLHPNELDYRKLRMPDSRSDSGPVIQISLLSESMSFQGLLSTYGITTQTPTQIESVYIWPSSKLVDLLFYHGADPSLGLTGRPKRPLGALCTSRLWKIGGKTVMCVPLFLDKQDFYISKDESYIADSIKIHLKFLRANWRHSERPTFIILLTPSLFKTNSKPLLSVLNLLQGGSYKDIYLKVAKLQELMPVAKKIEMQLHDSADIDFNSNRVLASPTLTRKSLSMRNISEASTPTPPSNPPPKQVERFSEMSAKFRELSDAELLLRIKSEPPSATNVIALIEMSTRGGGGYLIDGEKITDLLEYYYRTMESNWVALRCAAAFLRRTVDSLAPELSTILVSGRAFSLGVYGHPQILIEEPMNPHDLEEILHGTIREQSLIHVSLQQEFLIYLSQTLVDHPAYFEGISVVRIGSMIHVLDTLLYEQNIVMEELSPSALKQEIRRFLKNSNDFSAKGEWAKHRFISGVLGRSPKNLHIKIWNLLHHQEIEFLGSNGSILGNSTAEIGKPNSAGFVMAVEVFLDSFGADLRYLVIEVMNILICTTERNDAVNFVKRFDLIEFVEKSGVDVGDTAEVASKKFLDCLIKCEYAKLVDISDCALS